MTRFGYTIYDQATGAYVSGGSVSMARDLASQKVREGQVLIPEQHSRQTRLVDGVVVDIEAELPPATVQDVKTWAARLLSYTDPLALRSIDGAPMPPSVIAYRAAVRQRSNEIEAMVPIPPDYRDAKYWPNRL